ncbi:hypothetical protein KHQ81_07920 [Mycoplasmatota bacterium]|nr:hypothetical protein KHQ81_07920 [Mycoplasmatota bacterium]
MIVVTNNFDFLSDDINNINFIFIPLGINILELSDFKNGQFILRVRSKDRINIVASGDKNYFQFVKGLSSMVIERDSNSKYFYFPLYTISKNELLNSNSSYIAYNMKVEDIKIINNLNDINLKEKYFWKAQEITSIYNIRSIFSK